MRGKRVTFKRILRAILPTKLANALGGIRMRYREQQLRQLSLRQAFDEVYKKAIELRPKHSAYLYTGRVAENLMIML